MSSPLASTCDQPSATSRSRSTSPLTSLRCGTRGRWIWASCTAPADLWCAPLTRPERPLSRTSSASARARRPWPGEPLPRLLHWTRRLDRPSRAAFIIKLHYIITGYDHAVAASDGVHWIGGVSSTRKARPSTRLGVTYSTQSLARNGFNNIISIS